MKTTQCVNHSGLNSDVVLILELAVLQPLVLILR